MLTEVELVYLAFQLRAYAWSAPVEGSEKRKFYAVLHLGPIRSAQDAVKAAIVADERNRARR